MKRVLAIALTTLLFGCNTIGGYKYNIAEKKVTYDGKNFSASLYKG